jgi:hypothetical protein
MKQVTGGDRDWWRGVHAMFQKCKVTDREAGPLPPSLSCVFLSRSFRTSMGAFFLDCAT